MNFTSWTYVEITWPNFLIGPAIGFFIIYLPKKEWGFLIPCAILLLISGIFYSELIDASTSIIAVLFMLAGIALIFKSRLSRKNSPDEINKQNEDLRP
jgi:predicted membrane protein